MTQMTDDHGLLMAAWLTDLMEERENVESGWVAGWMMNFCCSFVSNCC